MNIDKIRSALEFARTRTPAGGPVSSQAESGLMALAEVEREFAAARALIEKFPKEGDYCAWVRYRREGIGQTWMQICDSDAEGAFRVWRMPAAFHVELRAFLEPVTPGKVAYTYGDAPIDPTKPHHFEAVGAEFPNTCRRCACFRNSVNHLPDKLAECGCAARKALDITVCGGCQNRIGWDGPAFPGGSDWRGCPVCKYARAALAAPCDCAGLREEIHGIEEALGFRGNPGEVAYVIRKKQQAFEMDRDTIRRRGEIINQLRADLASMTADRDHFKRSFGSVCEQFQSLRSAHVSRIEICDELRARREELKAEAAQLRRDQWKAAKDRVEEEKSEAVKRSWSCEYDLGEAKRELSRLDGYLENWKDEFGTDNPELAHLEAKNFGASEMVRKLSDIESPGMFSDQKANEIRQKLRDLAAALEREREMAEMLRSIHIERKWDVAEIAAIVARYDARKDGSGSGPLPGRDVTVVQTGDKTHFVRDARKEGE